MKFTEFSFCVSIFAVAFILGGIVRGIFFEQEAVEHGCAHYDTQTAHFTWGPGAEDIQCQVK